MFIREQYNGRRFNRLKRSYIRIALIILALGGYSAKLADRGINADFLSGSDSLVRSTLNNSAQDDTSESSSPFNPAGAQVLMHLRSEPSLILKGLFVILASSRGCAVTPVVTPWSIRPPVWWLMREQPARPLAGS